MNKMAWEVRQDIENAITNWRRSHWTNRETELKALEELSIKAFIAMSFVQANVNDNDYSTD